MVFNFYNTLAVFIVLASIVRAAPVPNGVSCSASCQAISADFFQIADAEHLEARQPEDLTAALAVLAGAADAASASAPGKTLHRYPFQPGSDR